MKTAFLFHRLTRQATTILLLLFAVATMWSAHIPALQFWAERAGWIALGYLLFGMFLLTLRRTRLMFVCLGCSAAISLFFNVMQVERETRPLPDSPPTRHLTDSIDYELTAPHR